jgi:hypothetical protein
VGVNHRRGKESHLFSVDTDGADAAMRVRRVRDDDLGFCWLLLFHVFPGTLFRQFGNEERATSFNWWR